MTTTKLPENCGLDRLPPELLTKIAGKLDWPDQITLLSTDPRFKAAAMDDALVAVRAGVAADIAAAPAAARRPKDVLKLWRVAAPKLRTTPLEPVRHAVGLAHDLQAMVRNPSRIEESSIPGLQAWAQEVQTQIGAPLPQVNRPLQRMAWTKAAQRSWQRAQIPSALVTLSMQFGWTAYSWRVWSHGTALNASYPLITAALGSASFLMTYAGQLPSLRRDAHKPSPSERRIEDVAFLRVEEAREAQQLTIRQARLARDPQGARAQAAYDAAQLRVSKLGGDIARIVVAHLAAATPE